MQGHCRRKGSAYWHAAVPVSSWSSAQSQEESALGMAVTITWTQTGGDLMFDQKKNQNDSRKRGCCSQSSTGGSWHLYSEQKLGVTVGKLCWESCSKMGSIFKEGLDHGSSGNQCWIITAIRTVGKNAFLVKLTDYSPHLPIPIWYLQLQHWLTRK